MPNATPNDLFLGLIAGLQASAWMQLGKVMDPTSGKAERRLEHAKETIDLLGALEEKTRGNLHPDESRLLTQILFELRMNYVEELKSTSAPPPAPPAGEAAAPPPAPAADAAAAPDPMPAP